MVRPAFSASRVQHLSDLHPKFALRPHGPHHVCVSMADIQSPTAVIRREKKKEEERKKEETIG